MKTVTQIAQEIGVSRQAVHKKIKQEPLSTSLQQFTSTVDNVVYIDVDGINLIKTAFLKNKVSTVSTKSVNESVNVSTNQAVNEAQVSGEVSTLIDILKSELSVLRNELDVKNKQIDELTATIRIQAESINADRKNELAETLIDGQKFIGTVPPSADQGEPSQGTEEIKNKKSFWSFFKK